MPAKVLLVSFGLRDNEQITGSRSIVADNVRWSSYFIQLFQDDWGPRDLFRKMFLLASECQDDSAMPMREVVVCLKNAPKETNSEILAFRKELDELKDIRVLRYDSLDELNAWLVGVGDGWAQSVIATETQSAAEPGHQNAQL